ncbi:VOC family protein [Granulicella sp. dw_53]|uniref:VOC family protein n=1 Tax=Granulicella sp. dw_53 TaxID=2719792 RepID=UPI001BD43BAF|nr:VOC family protein [Granulicella sp. dw_53]
MQQVEPLTAPPSQEVSDAFESSTLPISSIANGYTHTGIQHVGLHAKDLAATAEFYRDLFGMQIVGGSTSENEPLGATVFLSSRPGQESHEIALFAKEEYKHSAFKMSSLADLQSFHRRCSELELPIRVTANHGVSFALYLEDPSGNLIEVYWPTGVELKQPLMIPVDLTLTEKELMAKLDELSASVPSESAS